MHCLCGKLVKTMVLKRPTPRHIIIKIPKVKDKKRILKAARKAVN